MLEVSATLPTSTSSPAKLAPDKETPLIDIGKSRRAKIEIHWEEGVLRITADKNTAEHAANDVESALRNTETKKLNLKPWTPRLAQDKLPKGKNLVALYTQQDFDTVASITRTNVQKLGDHQVACHSQSWLRQTNSFSSSSADSTNPLLKRQNEH